MSEMRDLGGVVLGQWLAGGEVCVCVCVGWYALPNVFRHLRGVLRRAEGGGGGECVGCGCGVARDGASSVDATYHIASSTSGVGAPLTCQAAGCLGPRSNTGNVI